MCHELVTKQDIKINLFVRPGMIINNIYNSNVLKQ